MVLEDTIIIHIPLEVDDSKVQKAAQDIDPVNTDSTSDGELSFDLDEGAVDNLTKTLNGNASQARNLLGYAQNPESSVLNLLTKAGPAGLLAGSLIGIILSSPKILDEIVDILTAPGGPFDSRFKRIIEDEREQFFSRMDQERRKRGLDQVIITSQNGFRSFNGATVSNTLGDLRNDGEITIGLNESLKRAGG